MDKKLERAMGIEPTTSTLARWRSTAELRPLNRCRAVVFRREGGICLRQVKSASVFGCA
jgi:hypothetical protein